MTLDFSFYTGYGSYQKLDGCCQSTGSRWGMGMEVPLFKNWSLGAYTDRQWSEFTLHKKFVWGSDSAHISPSEDSHIRAKRIPDFIFMTSLGGGYFIHSTRTLRYDLPALVSGGLLSVQLNALSSIYENFFISLGAQGEGAFALDDKGVNSRFLFGLIWSDL